MFFKSIDHTLNHAIQNQNSQMFFNISSRQLKHTHLYASVFVDEFSTTRLGNSNEHNFLSYKGGAKIYNWPLQNVSMNYEFTHSNPMTYRHRVQATTFATNKYNLGHYLRDNSREHVLAIAWKPLSQLRLAAEYRHAWHGNHYEYDIGTYDIDKLPVLEDKSWERKQLNMNVSYEVLTHVWLKLFYSWSNTRGFDLDGHTADYYLNMFSPDFHHGKLHTVGFQFNMGF